MGAVNPDIAIDDVALVRDARSTAVVVELRSRAARPLTDVPISVGVRRGGRMVYLNAGRELGWFRTHVPAIPARGAATWVFRVPPGRRTRAGDVPFARVGIPGAPVVSSASALPEIQAAPAGGVTRGRARVAVENRSDIPQFGLQVYAYAREGGRYVTAGATTVKRLKRDERSVVQVPLTGRTQAGRLQIVAVPTIFQ
ncbi:hypothetical protein LRS13_07565 [Svornostia abyssi]|uniref:Uncharacterized protein n=1 Tax=Svornostia abyssi TaxID=2898438 RepID=A0ABY5PLD3_9ACTN|nr:hypothetical protein LRS13_07565 [Parviterribacteraceae bacterium J379]